MRHSVTFLVQKVVYGGSAIRALSSHICLVEGMAVRNEGMRERWRREQVAIDSKLSFLRALRTKLRSTCGSVLYRGGKQVE